MKLNDKEAHIWCFNINNFSQNTEFYESFLSPFEINKAAKFRFKKDRKTSIFTRGALRMLSSSYLNLDANKIDFKYGEYGKPQYGFDTSINFNVSHSGSYIVIAFVKNSDIGVDIEKIKIDFDLLKIADNFFSADEVDTLRRLSKNEQVCGFYRCWTRKESFIKAKSLGLTFPLASFTVSLEDNYAALLKTDWNPLEVGDWNLFSFRPHKNYVGALTVGKRVQKVKYFDAGDLKNQQY